MSEPTPPDLSPDTLRLFYRYDRALPLWPTVTVPSTSETLVIERFEISSRHGQRVAGLLFRDPRHEGPRPTVLIAHPATLDKDNPYVTTPAREWVAQGALCVTIDQAGHGERADATMDFMALMRYPARAADDAIQTGVDWMRVLDYLTERPEVDAGRIAFVGFSMGGGRGVPFVALDRRVGAAVFCITGASLPRDAGPGGARPGGPPAAEREALRPLTDPARYAPMIGDRPVLLVAGTRDDIAIPEAVTALYEALPGPKAIEWLHCGHWDFWPQGLAPIWPWLTAQWTAR